MPERPDITEGRFRFVTRMLGLMDNAIETSSRLADDSGYAPASGRVDLMYVEAYRDLTITQIGSMSRQTAVGTLNGHRKGLYTVDPVTGNLTLVARTGLQSSAVYTATNTEYVSPLNTTGGFPASYRMESGKLYAFGHFITWTTTGPVLKGYGTNIPSATLARAPRLAGGLNGQSDLPTSILAANVLAATGAVRMFAIP